MANRKPTLSPTRITTYLACPVKYKWSYVDERGRWFARAKSYYSFGTSLHKVLQRFHDEQDKGVETRDEAIASLEESWLTAGYRSPDEAAEALAEGREIVATYIDSQARRPEGLKTIFVEKQLSKDMNEFRLVGRLDRLDEREDGTLEIVDYKSGSSAWSAEDVANDIAMNCYQLLVREKFSDRHAVSTICSLRSGDSASASPEEGELDGFETELHALGIEILNRDYEGLEPSAKGICASCDFLELCRRHEEFEEEFNALIEREKPDGAEIE